MALTQCKQCGNQVATDAKICPKCGSPQPKRLGTGKLIFLILGGLVVFGCFASCLIGGLVNAAKSGGGTSSTTTTRQPQQAERRSAPMPADQAAFCRIIEEHAQQYRALQSGGANELKLSKLRTDRARALRGALSSLSITGWVGTLGNMGTTGDGKATVEVELPCSATLKTWNNALSDIGSNTLISQQSPLFDAIAELAEDAPVVVSGTLLRGDRDAIEESSVSERGSMTEPEFLLRFKSISAAR